MCYCRYVWLYNVPGMDASRVGWHPIRNFAWISQVWCCLGSGVWTWCGESPGESRACLRETCILDSLSHTHSLSLFLSLSHTHTHSYDSCARRSGFWVMVSGFRSIPGDFLLGCEALHDEDGWHCIIMMLCKHLMLWIVHACEACLPCR